MLITINEAKQMIDSGDVLFLAGDEDQLTQLPKGRWIGGTIPYFMAETGGVITKDKIFATKMPEYMKDIKIDFYDEGQLKNIPKDAPQNGFSFIIIPATSKAHISYAQNAPDYPEIFMKPIIGWISGVHLSDLGKISPKEFNGMTGEKSDDKAIVAHLALPEKKMAVIGIINIFKQGKGDSIRFETDGFSISHCLINGKNANFAEYLLTNKIDTKLPLVANYSGAMVNVSFQEIKEKEKIVNFYAPVFKNVEYKVAMPVNDYVVDFLKCIPDGKVSPVFACNCILNFLYSGLEGKTTGNITGPITFGEIAYQLLNQTLTYIEIKDIG